MRTLLVIELYESGEALPCIVYTLEAMFPIDDLCLKDPVDTFCYGIIRRFIILRHTDADSMLQEEFYIGLTAILYTSVGMMDKITEFVF